MERPSGRVCSGFSVNYPGLQLILGSRPRLQGQTHPRASDSASVGSTRRVVGSIDRASRGWRSSRSTGARADRRRTGRRPAWTGGPSAACVTSSGSIRTAISGAATIAEAVATFVGSAALSAVTAYVPGAAGAVHVPSGAMAPPSAAQRTRWSSVPETLAVNRTEAPGATAMDRGDTERVTGGPGGSGDPGGGASPPQAAPSSTSSPAAMHARATAPPGPKTRSRGTGSPAMLHPG